MECQQENNDLIYSCPHCSLLIVTGIHELNCRIFRHGFLLEQNQQIPPHESKEQCEKWLQHPGIIGCCKPYEIVFRENRFWVETCEYK